MGTHVNPNLQPHHSNRGHGYIPALAARQPFIVFEGGDGSGKTTQSRVADEHLTQLGHNPVLTREPGGTEGSMQLRKLLLEKDSFDWTDTSELLMMTAARVEHVNKLIRPTLEAGRPVLCDRFVGSTIALQGGGGHVPLDFIMMLHERAVGGLLPDLLIMLDIDAETGLGHSLARLGQAAGAESRFEEKGLEYHRRVNQAYREHAEMMGHKVVVIDACRSIAEVSVSVCEAIDTFMADWTAARI